MVFFSGSSDVWISPFAFPPPFVFLVVITIVGFDFGTFGGVGVVLADGGDSSDGCGDGDGFVR